MARRGLGFVLVCACACTIELAPRPRPPAAPPPSAGLGLSISSRTLPSGLRVVVVRDPTASEVQVTMRFPVGAAQDGQAPGLAHLVEHLMFLPELEGQTLFTHLEDISTSFNAFTSFEATTYITRAREAALAQVLAIEAVRLGDRCRTVNDAAFAREREVVVAELAQRDQTTEVYGALHRALYPEGHPYRRAIGGTADSVRAITRDQACAFADRYYAPSNAVLVISGRLAPADVDAALARIAVPSDPRAASRPVPQQPPSARAQHLEVSAPIDDDVLVVAWPLPLDPELQAKVRAIGAALPRLVDEQVTGAVVPIQLGDRGAPMFGIAVVPGDGETFAQVVERTRRGVEKLPRIFTTSDRDNLDEVVFARVTQGAILGMYSMLEDGSSRDERLASYVAEGRDPQQAIASELEAMNGLSRDEASDIAKKYLAANTPTVVTLKAGAGKKRGNKLKLQAPFHDLGRRRTPIDPGLASKPMEGPRDDVAPHARTRVLRNGLKVVLLPTATVPTFDARLIFASGTADEPADQRGVALIAANTLTFDLHHLNDALAFVRAGGVRGANVEADHTSFAVQGLDASLDVVLAGLRRWVRDGVYDDSAETYVNAMRTAAKRADDQGPLTDAWRASLFGRGHPYVASGLVRHTNAAITLQQAARFRAAHYSPDNATLVIAGRFDPDAAERWIDFLFADWTGHAEPRDVPPIASQPATIAKADDTVLLQLRIAFPVTARGRAQHLVAAEMLNDIAHDVRFRLGASYTLDAQLAETREAGFIVIGGFIDATRATAALELIRDRVTELPRDSTVLAQAFVIARAHVVTQLRSRVGSGTALADRVERDVELLREPLSDLATASAVQALTVADMKQEIAALDLARAIVLVDGPHADAIAALKVLGREAHFVEASSAPPAAPPTNAPPSYKGAEQHVLRGDVTAALTEQPLPRPMLTIGADFAAAAVSDDSGMFTGYSFVAEAGYRYGWMNALGAHLELGHLTKTSMDASGLPQSETLTTMNLAALWHLGGMRRTWGELLFGAHLEHGAGGATGWRSALLYGVHLGIDIIRHRTHRVAIAGQLEETTLASFGYQQLSIGLVYRR
jgi:zinc protease